MIVFGSSHTTGSIFHRGVSSAGRFARDQTRSSTLPVHLVSGQDAHALLADPEFRRGWCDLAQACHWTTPWQSFDHADVWFSVYRDIFEPLLLFQHDESGGLCGLLPLALNRETGALAHVGAHQAEYQVWLATETNGNGFIIQALKVLASRYPGRKLRLQYLPPDTPTAWCASRSWTAPRTILRNRRRPLLALGPESRVEESLRKKSNRSRINRLRRIAPLSLRHLTTSDALAPLLATVSDFCDFRQGAMNATLPFHDDPRKKDLWLRLLDKPGLVHASVLMVGDDIAAAHIGLTDGKTLSLGIIAHSPFLAEHSPGKVLMLLLSQELGRQGFETFDLTPDGAYKDRFADHNDVVQSLTVYFDPVGHAVDATKNKLRILGARMLGPQLGYSIKHARLRLRERLAHLWARAAPASRLGFSKPPHTLHTISASVVSALPVIDDFRVNCIDDLLLYKSTSRRRRQQFLCHALRRIEAGDRVYTLSRGGVLLHCAWVSNLTPSDGLDLPAGIVPTPTTRLLWDGFTMSIAEAADLRRNSLRQRLRDAASIPGVETLLIRTPDPALLTDLGLECEPLPPSRGVRRAAAARR